MRTSPNLMDLDRPTLDPRMSGAAVGMTAFGAQQKLVFEIGCFWFCPKPDL
jgi:hypothetical protein